MVRRNTEAAEILRERGASGRDGGNREGDAAGRQGGLADREAPEAPTAQPVTPGRPTRYRGPSTEPGRSGAGAWPRAPWKWVVPLLAVLLLVGVVALRVSRPTAVRVVKPELRRVTESIAVSGEVGGLKETLVGSQVPGVVESLLVRESRRVVKGQPIARVQNDVAEAQVREARQALATARAQLAQASAGARPSELQAARARVAQAQAAARQAETQVAQALARARQAAAQKELASTTLERNRCLYQEKALARAAVAEAQAQYRVAAAEATAAREGVDQAREGLAAARAASSAAAAELRTLEAGPRAENVAIARQQVRRAQAALRVAREQASAATLRAPFDGTVTEVLTEEGGTSGRAASFGWWRPGVRRSASTWMSRTSPTCAWGRRLSSRAPPSRTPAWRRGWWRSAPRSTRPAAPWR